MSNTIFGNVEESETLPVATTRGETIRYTFFGMNRLDLLLATLVGLGLAFQVGHFIEHAIQFAVWISGKSQWVATNFCGRETPFMSAPVTKAVSTAGAYLFSGAAAARQMMMGMEILHLVGNCIFFVTIAGVFYFIPGKLVRYAFYVEGAHLCEHVSLTLSAYYLGTPIGVSTLLGYALTLWGQELAVGWRVSWHFIMNLLPMPFVMIALMHTRRSTSISCSMCIRPDRPCR